MMTVIISKLYGYDASTEASFQGQALVDIPPNYHYDCVLAYPERYHKSLYAFYVQVTEKVQKEYNSQMKTYNRRQGTTMPRVSVSRWLLAAHRARIVSSFPELDILHDCKSLKFALEEMIEGY